jgi:hypothetical protein
VVLHPRVPFSKLRTRLAPLGGAGVKGGVGRRRRAARA